MDAPPEPMPKVSSDPVSPPAEPAKPITPPPVEKIVVTSHEGSVVAVPTADPTLEKATLLADVTPPSSPPPASPAPPQAAPVVPPAPVVASPPPTSPAVSPAPVIIQRMESIPVQATPSPVTVVTIPAKEPAAPAAVVVQTVTKETSAPASPAVITIPAATSIAPPAPLVLAAPGNLVIEKSREPLKTDKVPVVVPAKSAPELAPPPPPTTQVQAKPSVASFQSAPPETVIRHDTHVVVIEPVDDGKPKKTHFRDKIRKFWLKYGGAVFLRFLLGKPGGNVATAVVGRY